MKHTDEELIDAVYADKANLVDEEYEADGATQTYEYQGEYFQVFVSGSEKYLIPEMGVQRVAPRLVISTRWAFKSTQDGKYYHPVFYLDGELTLEQAEKMLLRLNKDYTLESQWYKLEKEEFPTLVAY